MLADAARDPEEAIGRIALRRLDDATRYGGVEMDGDRVVTFRERVELGQPGMINAGLYLFDRRVLDEVTPLCSLERDVMPVLASRGALRGTEAKGYFVDIGIPADLARALAELPGRLRRRALFLEYDGFVDLHQSPNGGSRHLTFAPGALTAIRTASDAGWHVFAVNGHLNSAYDLLDQAKFASLCARISNAVRAEGGTIDDLRQRHLPVEPHLGVRDETSNDHKPRPGILQDLLTRWELNAAHCLFLGSKYSDLAEAGAASIPAHPLPDSDLAEFVTRLLTLQT